MNFNSFQYMIFLPIVFALHCTIGSKYRWALLLVASYYFYMSWNPKYVFLILFTTVVTYFCGILLEKNESAEIRKIIIAGTLVACLGVLALFKYYNFAITSISNLFAIFSIRMHPVTLKLLLPVGISFYTFQTLSYVIDVYRGIIKAEHHFGIYATFISFFPQLVAGPIERSGNLLPQIKKEKEFDYDMAREGLLLMAWGYFKKMAIADTLAIYSDKIFNNVYSYKGLSLIVATVFFTIQIYCDFSGYSDIAIGTAKLFGIKLMDNFKSPYFSSSIKEFWSRWHISLSTWFKDYVYIPLGGNRVSPFRHKMNLLITFLVSGLWHGANWTFVAWGGIHGLGQIIESSLRLDKIGKRSLFGDCLRKLFVFCFVASAWILFRAQNFEEVIYVFKHLFAGIGNPMQYLYRGYREIYMQVSLIIRTIIMVLILFVHDAYSLNHNVQDVIRRLPLAVRWSGYLLFLYMIILFMPIGADQEFIYFQF